MNIPFDAFVVLSVGELNVNKNNRVIIKALERLKESNIHYILCGVGEQEKALQEQANKANLQSNVHLLGYRTDVKEIYAMSDCFVLPSYREGLSRSLMEAIASGLPCIASRVRGNTDLIENTGGGFLCDTNDISDYAEKLNLLATDSDLRRTMGRKCVGAISAFNIETAIGEIQKIYEKELSMKTE